MCVLFVSVCLYPMSVCLYLTIFMFHPFINFILTKKQISVRALRGRRLQMEDEYTIHDGGKFVAVFDGHGGSGVSRYLRQCLYSRLKYYLGDIRDTSQDVNITTSGLNEETEGNPASTRRFLNFLRWSRQASSGNHSKQNDADMTRHMNALQSAFRSVDREVLMDDRFFHQGSTAVVCMLHEHAHASAEQQQDKSTRTSLLVANIGDSRAVLSRNRKAVCLTKDHKPNDVMERSRIIALGENVEFDGFVHRVKDLALSRAIGDAHAKPYVSSEVDISRHLVLPHQDEFVILASDGLWDVLSNQEAVSFVHSKMDDLLSSEHQGNGTSDTKLVKTWKRKQMSRFLANEAMRRGTADNVCVVVVWLNNKDDSEDGQGEEDHHHEKQQQE
jgi:serine/threonine protein phosphatase PrpC